MFGFALNQHDWRWMPSQWGTLTGNLWAMFWCIAKARGVFWRQESCSKLALLTCCPSLFPGT